MLICLLRIWPGLIQTMIIIGYGSKVPIMLLLFWQSTHIIMEGTMKSITRGAGKNLWKHIVEPIIKLFISLFSYDKLTTLVYLCNLNLVHDSTCPFCHTYYETLDYLFNTCSMTMLVWTGIAEIFNIQFFCQGNFSTNMWLQNLSSFKAKWRASLIVVNVHLGNFLINSFNNSIYYIFTDISYIARVVEGKMVLW